MRRFKHPNDNQKWKDVFKEKDSSEQLQLSKKQKLNNQLINAEKKSLIILLSVILPRPSQHMKILVKSTKKFEGNKEKDNNDTITWKHGACLVGGDSVLGHIDETRMSRKFNVKVTPCPGAKISVMYHNLIPVLNKKPDCIILHVGTNYAFDIEASVIDNRLLQLKCL